MSHDIITPSMVTQEMLKFSAMLDVAHDQLVQASNEWAEAENEYRKSKANSWLASSGTVGDRNAMVDKTCERERLRAHKAEALKVAALEKVRSVRAQLNACQSVAAAVRSEMETAGRWSA